MITILSPVNVREDTTTTSWTLNLSGPGLNAPSASSARGIPTKHPAVTGQWIPKIDSLCIMSISRSCFTFRFCYSCIITWLNEGRTCPKDNSSLGEGDIFPDAMAHREILQLSVSCEGLSYVMLSKDY